MAKLIILRGLPASGKTTWAKEQKAKRINKDDLRAMIDNGKWSPDNEKRIIGARNLLTSHFLKLGYDVIVDDTNFAPKHEKALRSFADHHKAEFVIKDFTNVPVDVCIERDRKRPNSVGKRVIMDMYRKYLYKPPTPPTVDPSLPHAMICDLDGTLCVLDGRSPYDTAQCLTDKRNDVVYGIICGHYDSSGYEPEQGMTIFCSGREEKFRDLTVQWLKENGIDMSLGTYRLFMRPTGDFRKDAIIKQEIYDREIKGKYNIDFVLDDRNEVVELWRSLGLTCLQVADGDF